MSTPSSSTPPLLLIHGAWHGKWCYERYFVDYLRAQGFDVHAIDLPLHGEAFRGQRPLRFLSIGDYVEAVNDYAQKLSEPPVVIGHSMGGLVVQKYLEKYAAPAGVLLASVPTHGVWRIALQMLRYHPLRFLKANATMSLYPFVDDAELARANFFSAEIPPSDLATYHAKIHDESYRAFLDMLLLNLPKPANVNAPLLVLGGEKDVIFLPREVRKTAAAYGTEAIIFPNMAHDMMLEPGWQNVADTITEWIKNTT